MTFKTHINIYLFFCTLFSVTTCFSTTARTNTLEVTPLRVWKEFDNRNQASEQKVVLFCKVNIYRQGSPIRLKRLSLQWYPRYAGARPPRHLAPILYRPRYKQPFNPTSSAAVADGKWHSKTNTIHFDLHEKIMGRHQFYVVIMALQRDLDQLIHGSFVYTDHFPLITAQTS